MLRRAAPRLASVVSPHHPSYKATPRQVSCLFTARLEVHKCNKEIARLIGIRDQMFDSKFHVARNGNGWFDKSTNMRTAITRDVLDLQRRKKLLVDYIKRNEELNQQVGQQQAAAASSA